MSGWLDLYRVRFSVGIMMVIQYRFAYTLDLARHFIEPVVYMAVWTTVSRAQGEIAGFTTGRFAAYYIIWMLVQQLVLTVSPIAIANRIQRGDLSPLLLHPIHPIHRDIAANYSYKLIMLPSVLTTIAVLTLLFPPAFGELAPWQILAVVLSLLLASHISMVVQWTIGLAAFWITDIVAFVQLMNMIQLFLTGRIAPLAVMPDWITVLASILPFRWMLSFPVEIALIQITPAEALIGLLAQSLWLVLSILLLRAVWRAGLKRYTAVGA